jgi:hypothetical protein
MRHPGRVQSALQPAGEGQIHHRRPPKQPLHRISMGGQAGKIWGKDEKVYVPHRHTQKIDARSNAVGPKFCRRICSCPVTPPVCVRLRGSITRFSGIGGPVWPPVCAVPTALAGPSRFRRTAVPCGRVKSCRGGGRRLTEWPIGPGGAAGWRASWSSRIRFCPARKRLHGEEIRSSAASFHIPKRKTAGQSHQICRRIFSR